MCPPVTLYGKQLYRQRGIDLPDAHGLVFSDRPMKPLDPRVPGNFDLYLLPSTAGAPLEFGSTSWNAALLAPSQPRTYATCRDDTRYTDGGQFETNQLPSGGAFCLTNKQGGMIALVRVTGRSAASDASVYVTLDITLWQAPGRQESGS